MSDIIETTLESSSLVLLPSAWYWECGYRLKENEPRSPSFRFAAVANWLTSDNWFNDGSLDSIRFEITLFRFDGEPKRYIHNGLDRSYGALRFEELRDIELVSGDISVPTDVFDDLEKRLRGDKTMPWQVSVRCHGVKIGFTPPGREDFGYVFWDTANCPALDVIGMNFTYTREGGDL